MIAPEAQTARILPVIGGLADLAGLAVSVDTRSAEVAAKALAAGATMISDGALLPGDSRRLSATTLLRARERSLPGVIDPAPDREDMVFELFDRLEARVEANLAAGIPHARLVIDPGVDCDDNDGGSHAILNELALFHGLGCPLLLGLPRDAAAGDQGRKAVLRALDQGAQILRAQDVAEIRRVLDFWERLIASGK
jgi:dihydropteroate synthase